MREARDMSCWEKYGGKGKMEEKSCFKDLQGRGGVKQLGESRNAGDRAAGRGLGWVDGWMDG